MIAPLLFEELTLLEPHRMELARALAAADSGELTFVDLRRHTGLTDGNLNRHLHRMEVDGVVGSTREKLPGRHPRKLIRLTARGRERLNALASALRKTATELNTTRPGMRVVRVRRTTRAAARDATLVAPTPVLEETTPVRGSLVSEAFIGPD